MGNRVDIVWNGDMCLYDMLYIYLFLFVLYLMIWYVHCQFVVVKCAAALVGAPLLNVDLCANTSSETEHITVIVSLVLQ